MAFELADQTKAGQLKSRHLDLGVYSNVNLSGTIYFDSSISSDQVASVFGAVADSISNPEYIYGSAVEYSQIDVTTKDYYQYEE